MKRTYKLALLFICLVFVVVLVAACTPQASPEPAAPAASGNDTPATPEPAQGGRTIGLILISGINSHCQELEASVREIVEGRGDRLVVLDSQFDTAREVQNIEDLITQKVDGICIEVTGYDTSTGALQAAKDAGIPVAGNDQMVKADDLVVSQVVSDNVMAGELCAADMIAEIGEEGEVIVISIPGMTATAQRTEGFMKGIADYPGIKVVAEGNGEGLIDKAATITESFIQANPNVKGVFGANDPCALGALSAYVTAGKIDEVKIYGVDGSIEGVQFIKEGKLAGTVRQRPADLGAFSVTDLYTVLDGGTIPESERLKYVEVFLINAANADQY